MSKVYLRYMYIHREPTIDKALFHPIQAGLHATARVVATCGQNVVPMWSEASVLRHTLKVDSHISTYIYIHIYIESL